MAAMQLNPEQYQAVTAPPSNMLILAGAGSGKTSVLTRRIAHLIEQYHVSPFGILAVTFTNKAAHEMRGRLESLLKMQLNRMWVGTFHGLCHRFLRTHFAEANLPDSFQILDSDDQLRSIKRIMKSLNIDDTRWPPKQAQWFINKQKEDLRRANNVGNLDHSYFTETMVKIYHSYEQICQRSGLVDFAELLLRTYETLRDNAELRAHYQQRFQHILIDEFQDTNRLQIGLLKLFKCPTNYIIAVGDDDQSIYSWRGARVENIRRFEQEFEDVQVIRLEQNYRSTQTILDAANAVIENNDDRLGKKLWTEGEKGRPIVLYAAFNERDEAYYIAETSKRFMQEGYAASDIAVLYRSNAQSRNLEEQFIDARIPYRIYGGLRYFDRAEIKDALGYLRLIANRHDDAAFERVVNLPTRGVGNATLVTLRETARDNGMSLWQAAEVVIEHQKLPARASKALNEFLILINTLDATTSNLTLGEQTQTVLEKSTLLEHYQKDKSETGVSKVENLEELISATSAFKPEENELELPPLAAFLAHVALETGQEQAETHSSCVNLMTLHSAKGLEFPLVIIAGMEDELFPHKMSLDEPNGLAEERRLCYVGMTRAKERLVLTYAESRRLHGRETYNGPSRFISEIPENMILAERAKSKITRPTSNYSYSEPAATPTRFTEAKLSGDTKWRLGMRVNHKKFGSGVILNYEGNNEHLRLQVKFDQHGTKWLVANYANLEPTN